MALAAALAVGSPDAVAGDPPASAAPGAQTADTLFQQGLGHAQAGRYVEAIAKFEESMRLDPSAGTALNLGRCYQEVGRAASAQQMFAQAAIRARVEKKPDFEAKAIAAAGELEPRLARLRVEVPPEARIAGLVVRRGALELSSSTWGTALPVDPGEYEVTASAPGYTTFAAKVSVTSEPGVRVVKIVPLVPEGAPLTAPAAAPGPPPGAVPTPATATTAGPVPALPPPTPPPRLPPGSSAPEGSPAAWPWVVGGAGVLLGAVAVGFVVDQQATQRDVYDHCDDLHCTTSDGFDPAAANARLDRDFGLFVGLGAASLGAIGAGLVGLVVTAGEGGEKAEAPTTARATFAPWVGARAAGALFTGDF